MRRIGSLPDSATAQKFCDYLLTKHIDATFDGDESAETDIWIRDETAVADAKTELEAFVSDSGSAKYDVGNQVKKIRDEKIAEQQRRMRNFRKFESSGMPGRGMGGGGMRQGGVPITIAIILLSVAASFAANLGRGDNEARNAIRLANGRPIDESELSTEARVSLALSFVDRARFNETDGDGLASIKQGQIWRIFTPMFLHGSTMHLLFNMLWIYMLGSNIERLQGSGFLIGLVLFTHAIGMIVQVFSPQWFPEPLRGSPFVIGASGAVYGLFGYLWIRPKIKPSYPIGIPSQNVVLMIGWLFVCMTPLIPGVANGAHVGGLIGGVLMAVALPKNLG